MISWLSILPCITLAFGVVLITRGVRGVRAGDRPHCANCDFDLTGLDPQRPGVTRRCPECGGVLGERRAVVLGDRTPQRAAFWGGALLLLVSASVPAAFLSGRDINWRAALPTGILIGWLQTADDTGAREAAVELVRRLDDPGLSPAQLRDIFDNCLARDGSLPGPTPAKVWSPLLDAAYDAGVVDGPRREAHLRRLFGRVERTLERLRPVALAGDPSLAVWPGGPEPAELTPIMAFDQSWAGSRQAYGVVASLKDASLDGRALRLAPGPDGADHTQGPRADGLWIKYGAVRGADTRALPQAQPRLELAAPPPGAHRLDLRWSLAIYELDRRDADTDPLTRAPDHAMEVSLAHDFRVVSSIDEAIDLVRPGDPDAPPPPVLLLDDPDTGLRVTQRRPLANGSGWLYEVTATPRRDPRTDDHNYALLGLAHLVIGGEPFESVDPRAVLAPTPGERRSRWSNPRVYDAAPSAGAPRSRRFDGTPRPLVLQLINLPRTERADLVITPDPGLVLQRPELFPEQAYWDAPIVLRNVRLDWSALADDDPDRGPDATPAETPGPGVAPPEH